MYIDDHGFFSSVPTIATMTCSIRPARNGETTSISLNVGEDLRDKSRSDSYSLKRYKDDGSDAGIESLLPECIVLC